MAIGICVTAVATKLNRHNKAKLDIGHAQCRLDQQKQRRQHQMIKMADQMRPANQPDGSMLAALQRGGESGHSLYSPAASAFTRVPELKNSVVKANTEKPADAEEDGFRREIVIQPAINRATQRLTNQKTCADKAEHGTNRQMRCDVPNRDITRRICHTAHAARYRQQCNRKPEGEQIGAYQQHHDGGDTKTNNQNRVIAGCFVRQQPAWQDQQQGRELVDDQACYCCRARDVIQPLKSGDGKLGNAKIRDRRPHIKYKEKQHRAGGQKIPQAVADARLLLDLVSFR